MVLLVMPIVWVLQVMQRVVVLLAMPKVSVL